MVNSIPYETCFYRTLLDNYGMNFVYSVIYYCFNIEVWSHYYQITKHIIDFKFNIDKKNIEVSVILHCMMQHLIYIYVIYSLNLHDIYCMKTIKFYINFPIVAEFAGMGNLFSVCLKVNVLFWHLKNRTKDTMIHIKRYHVIYILAI